MYLKLKNRNLLRFSSRGILQAVILLQGAWLKIA
jgi:hypothetical protein